MDNIYLVLPVGLLIFGVAWYLHVLRLLSKKSVPMNALLGLGLFFGPLLGILIPLYVYSGAHILMVILATLVAVVTSTILFTSAVIEKLDGYVIVYFLFITIGLFGLLSIM